jgi:serine/threonine protein kinase/Flp pilus assembly protein TadD
MSELTGQTILRYKIIEQVGQGGMGVVYKAEDTKLKREVAIKFLPHHIAADAEDRKRFEIEAQAAASLNNPNITTIYSIEEYNGDAFIVMEYIDGIELKEKIRSGPLPMNEITDISVQIIDGLKAAHEKGIIHRDIKSQNIMLTKNGKIKIMDFGLAKIGGVTQTTKIGTTMGTIAYMSPEQLRGEEIDQRTDIWAFGVVLYEMVTGELPYKGDYEAALIYSILNEDIKPVRSIRKDVPENIEILISRLLKKNQAERINSLNGILDMLKTNPSGTLKEKSERSIAVLYFENMSPEKENEYFCAGITEDIIIDLSKIKGLKVIPRSDVLPFRTKEVNSAKVGEILGVSHILEGTVRKAGQRIRVTCQLIDIHNGFSLWSERYDRLLEDIFEVQIELSQKIAEALKVSLSESEKKMLAKKPTDDLRAYDFYMRGRDYLNAGGKINNELAIKMFEHAISIDANYALAYIGLSDAYSFQYMYYDGDQKWLGMIISASEKAKELDPDLLEVGVTKSVVLYYQKRFEESKYSLRKFIEKKDDNYLAYFWLGVVEEITKEYQKAVVHFEKAAEIKPYSEEPWLHIEMVYRRMGDLSASKNAAEKMLQRTNKKLSVNPRDGIALSRVAATYAILGDRESALSTLASVLEMAPNDGLAIYNCACTYAQLGEKEKSFEYLRKAINIGYKNIIEWIDNDPDFKAYKTDPEFKAILSKVGG